VEYRQGLEPFAKIVVGDRRLTMRLMGIWQGLRYGQKTCAPAVEFCAAVPDDLWADCCIVTRDAAEEWELRRIGETIARRSSVRGRKARIAELRRESILAMAVSELDDAIKSGAPILNEGEAQDEHGYPALYRSILLPLAGEGGAIVQLLAGARCRVRPQNG